MEVCCERVLGIHGYEDRAVVVQMSTVSYLSQYDAWACTIRIEGIQVDVVEETQMAQDALAVLVAALGRITQLVAGSKLDLFWAAERHGSGFPLFFDIGSDADQNRFDQEMLDLIGEIVRKP